MPAEAPAVTTNTSAQPLTCAHRLQDNFGIPQPQRSLSQIQEHARQLRQNAGGVSTLGERRAAASLLGASLDTAALTKKTVDFNVQGSQEGALAEESWSVEDYMGNAARLNVALTIQVRIPGSCRILTSRVSVLWSQAAGLQ
jgi:hypothetical protein